MHDTLLLNFISFILLQLLHQVFSATFYFFLSFFPNLSFLFFRQPSSVVQSVRYKVVHARYATVYFLPLLHFTSAPSPVFLSRMFSFPLFSQLIIFIIPPIFVSSIQRTMYVEHKRFSYNPLNSFIILLLHHSFHTECFFPLFFQFIFLIFPHSSSARNDEK